MLRIALIEMFAAALVMSGTPSVPSAPVRSSGAQTCSEKATVIGMAAPVKTWNARLAELPDIRARRLYANLTTIDSIIDITRQEIAAGRLPILSLKLPKNDWAGAAKGSYDAQLHHIATRLAALPGRSVIAVHHEPAGDGTPEHFAAMQARVLPILGAPKNVDSAVIMNGFWWTAGPKGKSDAEIATWLPANVIAKAEIVAADTYEGGQLDHRGEGADVKIRRFAAWGGRIDAKRLGIAEYNGLTPASLTAASDAILADPRFEFGIVFNSNVNNRDGVHWHLDGERLEVFRATVAKARALVGCPAAK